MIAVLRAIGAVSMGALAGVVFLRTPIEFAFFGLATIITVLGLALVRPEGFRGANVALSGFSFAAVIALTVNFRHEPSLDDEITSLPSETTVEGIVEILADDAVYLWADRADRGTRVTLPASSLRVRELIDLVEKSTGKRTEEGRLICGNGQPFFPPPALRLTLVTPRPKPPC